MKKLILLLFILPLSLFGQEKVINGISFNGPEGFKMTDELTWRKGDEIINISYFTSDMFDENKFQRECEKGTRKTEYISYTTFNFNGKEYFICSQLGDNGLLIGQLPVQKGGYTYIFSIAVNPADFEDQNSVEKTIELTVDRLGYIAGYMLGRTINFKID